MHLLVSPMYVRKWLLYKTADSNRGEVPHSQKERRWFPSGYILKLWRAEREADIIEQLELDL